MKRQLFSLFAVGISFQAIPPVFAEESTVFKLTQSKGTEEINFINLKPKSPMPMLKNLPNSYATSSESYRLKGGVNIPKRTDISSTYIAEPSNYGETKFPYTTAVVKPLASPKKKNLNNVATSARPYLTAGKLWIYKGESWYICSGSLIGKGVVATAAHCVADYGANNFGNASRIYFIPAATKNFTYASSAGPIGSWSVKEVVLPGCYTAGNCASVSSRGVQTSNDLALLVLDGEVDNLPFAKGAGTYGYGWNGYGFTTGNTYINSSKKLGQITQLGYPAALGDTSRNRGGAMIRTDSMAVYYQPKTDVKNFIWGSQQTGGSSGGPVNINFGRQPNISNSAFIGLKKNRNILVGVTSWGFINKKLQLQGASWFGQNKEYPSRSYRDKAGKNWGAGNIGWLMREVCGSGYGDLNSDYCGY